MSLIQKRYARSPEGKRVRARGIKIALAAKRRAHATNGAAAADDAIAHGALGAPFPPAPRNPGPSGRAMLVELARPEAARRIQQLQREIEKLTLFLARTK